MNLDDLKRIEDERRKAHQRAESLETKVDRMAGRRRSGESMENIVGDLIRMFRPESNTPDAYREELSAALNEYRDDILRLAELRLHARVRRERNRARSKAKILDSAIVSPRSDEDEQS